MRTKNKSRFLKGLFFSTVILLIVLIILEINYVDEEKSPKLDKEIREHSIVSQFNEQLKDMNDYKIGRASNYSYVPSANAGTSLGLVDESYQSLDERRNFETSSGNHQGTIAIVNQNKTNETYLILPLINYQQTPIKFNDTRKDSLKIVLAPGEIGFVPFEVQELKKGLNDLLFLVVPNPDDDNLSEEYRLSTSGFNILSVRSTVECLKIESEEKTKMNFEKINEVSSIPLEFEGIFLTKRSLMNPWINESVATDDDTSRIFYKMNLHVPLNQEFIVLSFLNWEQVSISSKRKIVYSEHLYNPTSVVEGEIATKQLMDRKVNNFSAILIKSPFKKVNPLSEEFMLEFSARVALTTN